MSIIIFKIQITIFIYFDYEYFNFPHRLSVLNIFIVIVQIKQLLFQGLYLIHIILNQVSKIFFPFPIFFFFFRG